MVKRVLIIAGEASGDLHGSGVVRELKRLNPAIDLYGVGGELMKQAGMELVYHIKELGFMGFVEVLKHIPVIRSVQQTLESLLKHRRPDVVLLIDYPGFNLRFAAIAKQAGIKVAYYISPQVWAWHRSRVKKMRSLVDQMLVVFPFEVDLYRSEGVPVEFVGHPLLEVLRTDLDRNGFCKRYGLNATQDILGLVPGSRVQEIEKIFPEMLRAARELAGRKGMQVVVAVAPTIEEQYFRSMFNMDGVTLIKGATYEVMAYSHFALVTSGTATLETALFGTPMVVVYRTSWMTYLLGRMLIRVKNIGLVNIVAEKQIVPECIQHHATARRLVETALGVLEHASTYDEMKRGLFALRAKLGEIGASRRVAQRITELR
jgi:lipid-A-disaccharide synthase